MAGNSTKLSIEERLTWLEIAVVSREPARPKIQRVAQHLLRDGMHYEKHYAPKLMSLGPIHYGDPKLQLGEKYKQMWTAMYIKSTGQAPQTLLNRIAGNIENLKELFAADLFTKNELFCNYSDQGFTDLQEMMCWTLFVDGCALLQILAYAKLRRPNEMNVKVEQLILPMKDVILLENQVPYLLLKLLWRDTNELTLIQTIKEFVKYAHWPIKAEDMMNSPPTHLLDLQRSVILYDPRPRYRITDPYVDDSVVTYRNIMDLKAAGIELKSSKTRRPGDISFSLGWFRSKLTLPKIIVDDTSAATILNLIAFEMCPDFENDYGFCAYISFLDSLIDHPDDVKELRSKRILLNSLGIDEEVVNLFKTVSSNLVPEMGKYSHVRAQMKRHFYNKTLKNETLRTWLALAYNTYFSNPWSIIAFLATVLGLALTFIQTWCAIHQPK